MPEGLPLRRLMSMARKKEFDELDVLNRAMEIFWRQGYEGTSIQDLVEQMGINRGSLYGTFADKRALFLAAIQHYDRTVIAVVVERLHEPHPSARQQIIDYIMSVAVKAASPGQREGCFLTNSAVEVGAHDPEAERSVLEAMRRIEQALYEALVRARRAGEIRPQKDLRALARYLTSSIQGLQVMGKILPDKRALLDIAEIIVAALD